MLTLHSIVYVLFVEIVNTVLSDSAEYHEGQVYQCRELVGVRGFLLIIFWT